MPEPAADPTPPTRWHRASRGLAWGLGLLPWPLVFIGPVLGTIDRDWFLCSPLKDAWLVGGLVGLGVMAASALYGLFGVILADGRRGPFVAALLLPLGLAAAITLGGDWIRSYAGMGTHSYCADGPDGRRLRVLGDGAPVRWTPRPEHRACTADADCVAWPSGCCAWVGLNRAHARAPGPGAECEMACRNEPTEVRCVSGQCELLGPRAAPGGD